MSLYIFSDAHLGAGDQTEEKQKQDAIAKLIKMVKADGDRLVILGDLFEFWFEYKHAVPKDHHRVLFMLHELVERGITVDYVAGNHDFWIGDFFRSQVGLNVHPEHLDLEYNGQKLHLIHGDGLAPADRGYRFLKRILRNKLNIWLYRKITPDWGIPLAKFVAGGSRKYSHGRNDIYAPDYRNYAINKLDNGYDTVVIGHLHSPIFDKFDSGTYLNTGDFIRHFSYVKITDQQASLNYLT